jgi:hypothetical protein
MNVWGFFHKNWVYKFRHWKGGWGEQFANVTLTRKKAQKLRFWAFFRNYCICYLNTATMALGRF